MRVIRILVTGVLIAAVLGAVTFWVIGVIYFGLELPHTPLKLDPVHGYIYPYNNHDVIHFVTQFDHDLDNISGILAFTCIPILIVGGMLAMAYNESKDRHLPK